MSQPRRFRSASFVLALAAAGTAGGAAVQVLNNRVEAAPSAAVTAVAAAARTVGTPDFSAITDSYGPAVVNITVSGTRKTSGPAPGMDPFEQFRRGMPGQGMPRGESPVRGSGSGFILSDDGLILTNAHVVDGADEVTVKLTDRREFQAKVLGADARTDVAVLKIEASKLPIVKLGKADTLRVGEWVLAIGSPFGLENTVTAGVVSAKGRSLPSDSAVPFIQTDVAVNPGNSGGPLFNGAGEVVGINSQIYSRSGGYQGLSFAIPIDLALRVKDQIVATGKVEHAKLGVSIQEVNQALADSFKLERPQGALVANVEAGSAADKAGLKVGDVVTKVDGKPILGSGDLPASLGQRLPGDKVMLEVVREGKPVQLTAQLGKSSEDGEQKQADAAPAQQGRLGLALAQTGEGLVVQQVTGPAAKAGVKQGDVLLSVNGKAAKDIEQVREAVNQAGKSVALLVQREGRKLFVPVPLA
ncbi:Do family serine endopeptidase [Ramlibacter rhizophilus]|uniref:Probable periplasmic serine endoprotease DegP-like n=1 Tax=Ramlibacter rhizophilus TaxID=1781167 RepID=A0A4Z0BPW2_9BURK|nr:Do family serine endopeptidase [Ramlibacter rhizophilus]TFZ01333.1 Do family serine endopeptidase [Ramlibacter rhizophilus]